MVDKYENSPIVKKENQSDSDAPAEIVSLTKEEMEKVVFFFRDSS